MPIVTIVIIVNLRQDKAKQVKIRQGKRSEVRTRQDEIYIDPLHIMTMTTITTTMTIIIQ